MRKRIGLLIPAVLMVMFLAGCSLDQPITSESDSFWDKYFVYPLSWLIIEVAEFFNGNYGLGIVIVTILIRTVLLPLMIKQTKSSISMQRIQPDIKALREKYSSKDQKTQQKLQQETMQLFQKHGVNPLAGCMPLIIQMPILLGFYHAIMRTEEIANHNFLWFDLGNPDPIYLLPLIAGLTTYLQQRIMMGGTDSMEANPQMKMLLYIMPIMIVVFAITFPAALSLYWVVGNIFMIAQTYFITLPMKNKESNATGGAKK
ncbi:YidC family membrane integrase SpoIIIJ [Pseudalkalibacillus sp. R45]|uniref:YidC family membrane integrase SpoIIIJ n=1 Tax=Pseudalkalibacillus sp. R45 TaxID=3457433 RepID=UPI003FCD32E2